MPHGTTRALRPALAVALLGAGAAAGCGGGATSASTRASVAPADECVIHTTGDSVRPPELVLAVSTPHDSALILRQRVDPPIRLDCLGRPRPGLASTWTADSSGRVWTLTVGGAGALAQSWHGRREAAAALWYAGVQSVVPLDDSRLVVSFREAHDSVPTVFADPALGHSRDSLELPVLRAVAFSDPRDAIDQNIHLIRTADRTALEYSARRPGLVTVPLPWDRMYVLLLPAGSAGLGSLVGRDSASFRAALAAGAVQVEARGAEAPFWWESTTCPVARVIRTAGPPASSAVVYERRDVVARGLAERVVAMSEQSSAVTRGVDASELSRALAAGSDLGYILALPRRALVPCRESARWLAPAGIVPLIDTRDRLILREGLPPLEVDFEGGIRPVRSP